VENHRKGLTDKAFEIKKKKNINENKVQECPQENRLRSLTLKQMK